MRSLLITLFSLSFLFSSFGQNTLGVKLYQNTDLFTTKFLSNPYPHSSTKVNFSRLSVAFDIESKRKVFHELELFIPEINKAIYDIQYPMNYTLVDDGASLGKVSSYSARYEISRSLTKKHGRLSVDLGIGINPYYISIRYFPIVSTRYYTSDKYYGISYNITPRMKYVLSKRFCLDLSIPLKVFDLRSHQFHVDNPSIPNAYHTRSKIGGNAFEQVYTLRFGIRYTIK